MKHLTERQKEIFDYLANHMQNVGRLPTYRQIQAHLNLSSLSSVFKHMQALKHKGALQKLEQTFPSNPYPGNYEKKTAGIIDIPLKAGLVKARIEPYQGLQTIQVPALLIPHPLLSYALRIQDDTYAFDECILEGDVLLVENRSSLCEGEMALLQTPTSEILIKRYYTHGEGIMLQSACKNYQDVFLRRGHFHVLGSLLSCIRTY